ncbi:MAG TPA: ion transporter [Bacteroidales bacterium]|nr:ion transporter [Bacteroidales bacterium]
MKRTKLRNRLYKTIFHTDTKAGKTFDVILLVFILLNVFLVMLDSVEGLHDKYGNKLLLAEYIITGIFTIEYFLRIYSTRSVKSYVFSFYGIIDLLSIIPTFLVFVFSGAQSLVIIRALRLLRLFRVFKLNRYTNQGRVIIKALKDSWAKISVFLFGVITIVLVIGTIMYMVEGAENGFTNIPTSIYWTIVTVTTVGFGDITPVTAIGKIIASFTMILGYAIIAVPTGIVTVEMSKIKKKQQNCPRCNYEYDVDNDIYCSKCGLKLIDNIK